MTKILKIVSGGQMGVDRAALDFAISRGIEHGGWVPKGRKAEDGTIPACYRVTETRTSKYSERTRRNVLDSDGTLIVFDATMSGGTALTYSLAVEREKPVLPINVGETRAEDAAKVICSWIRQNRIRVLNIAGPRESQSPGIYRKCYQVLEKTFNH